MSMLAAIKGKEKPPINVVNGDILVVETTDGGEPKVLADTRVGTNKERPKFRPIDPAARTQVVIEEPEVKDAPSKHFDLVGDDIGAPQKTGKTGRPRLHPNNAAKQAAYRDRLKSGA